MARPWPSEIRPSAIGGLHDVVELQEPERVRDRRARPPHPGGEVLLRKPELINQLSIRPRRLNRVEIFALQVLDQGQLELLAIRQLSNDGRDVDEAGGSCCPDASLARDELVAVHGLRDEHGWITPCSRMLAVSVASAASSIRRRGCRGLARIRSIEISIDPVALGSRGGISAARPRPRPDWTYPRVPITRTSPVRAGACSGPDPELLGKRSIGDRATRIGGVVADRLAMAGRLREPDAPRNHGLEDMIRQMRSAPRWPPGPRGSSGRHTWSGPRPRSRATG